MSILHKKYAQMSYNYIYNECICKNYISEIKMFSYGSSSVKMRNKSWPYYILHWQNYIPFLFF